MRLPNGFGTVYKDKSRPLRKPYKAVVTVGWKIKDDKALPVRKCIGYYSNKADALQALIDYSNNGLPEVITFGDAMRKWYAEKESGWSDSTKKQYSTIMSQLYPIDDRNIADLRVADLERMLDKSAPSGRAHMKGLMRGAYEWAMRHDYCDKDYSRLTKSYGTPAPKREKIPFTEEEIKKLWREDSPVAKSVLVAIYSGWRWNELMNLQIDEENDCMVGGSKTEAGKGRMVPIHHRIKPLLEDMYVTSSYAQFRRKFDDLMQRLGFTHTIHETRHTTATRLYGQDSHLVKLILGHAEPDFTKRVYTHNTIEQLREVIESQL